MGCKETDVLLLDLNKLKRKVKPGDEFVDNEHPNVICTVLSIGFVEGIEDPCVTYQSRGSDNMSYAVTRDRFLGRVTLEDGTEVDRFTKLV